MRTIAIEANLTNRDAIIGPRPYVKWSHEPVRAQDVPAGDRPGDPPRHAASAGPAFVSIPMDDWGAQVDDDRAQPARAHAS